MTTASSPKLCSIISLAWVNGQWIRRIATENGETVTQKGIDELYTRTADFWPESAANFSDDYKKSVLGIIYDRLKTLSDLRTMTTYFFEDPAIDVAMITGNKFLKNFTADELRELLKVVITDLSTLEDWNEVALQNTLNELLAKTGRKPAELFSLIRLSLSFAPFSPALNLTLEVLGKEISLRRLENVSQNL